MQRDEANKTHCAKNKQEKYKRLPAAGSVRLARQVAGSSGLPNECHLFSVAAVLMMRAEMDGVALV